MYRSDGVHPSELQLAAVVAAAHLHSLSCQPALRVITPRPSPKYASPSLQAHSQQVQAARHYVRRLVQHAADSKLTMSYTEEKIVVNLR